MLSPLLAQAAGEQRLGEQGREKKRGRRANRSATRAVGERKESEALTIVKHQLQIRLGRLSRLSEPDGRELYSQDMSSESGLNDVCPIEAVDATVPNHRNMVSEGREELDSEENALTWS